MARYPIRSGPNQMAAYLADAATLHIEILRGYDMAVIGKVQVYGLSAIAAGKSLNGSVYILLRCTDLLIVSVSMCDVLILLYHTGRTQFSHLRVRL